MTLKNTLTSAALSILMGISGYAGTAQAKDAKTNGRKLTVASMEDRDFEAYDSLEGHLANLGKPNEGIGFVKNNLHVPGYKVAVELAKLRPSKKNAKKRNQLARKLIDIYYKMSPAELHEARDSTKWVCKDVPAKRDVYCEFRPITVADMLLFSSDKVRKHLMSSPKFIKDSSIGWLQNSHLNLLNAIYGGITSENESEAISLEGTIQKAKSGFKVLDKNITIDHEEGKPAGDVRFDCKKIGKEYLTPAINPNGKSVFLPRTQAARRAVSGKDLGVDTTGTVAKCRAYIQVGENLPMPLSIIRRQYDLGFIGKKPGFSSGNVKGAKMDYTPIARSGEIRPGLAEVVKQDDGTFKLVEDGDVKIVFKDGGGEGDVNKGKLYRKEVLSHSADVTGDVETRLYRMNVPVKEKTQIPIASADQTKAGIITQIGGAKVGQKGTKIETLVKQGFLQLEQADPTKVRDNDFGFVLYSFAAVPVSETKITKSLRWMQDSYIDKDGVLKSLVFNVPRDIDTKNKAWMKKRANEVFPDTTLTPGKKIYVGLPHLENAQFIVAETTQKKTRKKKLEICERINGSYIAIAEDSDPSDGVSWREFSENETPHKCRVVKGNKAPMRFSDHLELLRGAPEAVRNSLKRKVENVVYLGVNKEEAETPAETPAETSATGWEARDKKLLSTSLDSGTHGVGGKVDYEFTVSEIERKASNMKAKISLQKHNIGISDRLDKNIEALRDSALVLGLDGNYERTDGQVNVDGNKVADLSGNKVVLGGGAGLKFYDPEDKLNLELIADSHLRLGLGDTRTTLPNGEKVVTARSMAGYDVGFTGKLHLHDLRAEAGVSYASENETETVGIGTAAGNDSSFHLESLDTKLAVSYQFFENIAPVLAYEFHKEGYRTPEGAGADFDLENHKLKLGADLFFGDQMVRVLGNYDVATGQVGGELDYQMFNLIGDRAVRVGIEGNSKSGSANKEEVLFKGYVGIDF